MYIDYEINDSGLNSLSQSVNFGLKKLHVICKNKGTEKKKSDRLKTKNINSRMALLIIDKIEFKSTEQDK